MTKSTQKSPIADRLRELMRALGLSTQAELADRMGVSRQFINDVLTVKKPYRQPVLSSFADHGVNLNWLLTGTGRMLEAGGAEESGLPGPATPGVVVIVETDVRVSAGGGQFVLDETERGQFRLDEPFFREHIGIDPRHARMVRVRGDSMLPTLRPNDLILVHLAKPQPYVDGIWVLRMGDAVHVKRLQFMQDGAVRVLSDNPLYTEQKLNLRMEQPDFDFVGRVVWAYTMY